MTLTVVVSHSTIALNVYVKLHSHIKYLNNVILYYMGFKTRFNNLNQMKK